MSVSLNALFFDEPVLAISARGLEQLHARLESLPPAAANEYTGSGRSNVTMVGRVPVLGLYGVLAYRPSAVLQWLGGTSYQAFAQDLRQALATKPPAIVLDIDSPGGSVRGLEELSREVYDARGRTRLVAVANPLAASAAYDIAAQADVVFVTPSGEVGSIGAIATSVDLSGAYEKEGIKLRVFRSRNAPRKSLGNPDEPLTDAGAAEIQRVVDRAGARVAENVARGRGVSRALVERAFGQGAMFDSHEAVQAGLADAVGTLEDALRGGQNARVASSRSQLAARDLSMLEDRLLDADLKALQCETDIETLERQLRQPRTTREFRRAFARL